MSKVGDMLVGVMDVKCTNRKIQSVLGCCFNIINWNKRSTSEDNSFGLGGGQIEWKSQQRHRVPPHGPQLPLVAVWGRSSLGAARKRTVRQNTDLFLTSFHLPRE